jgi:hypothetical protein
VNRLWLVPLALILVRCRHKEEDGTVAPEADRPRAPVAVVVQNHHWLDLNIYLIRGNTRQRLGTVSGASDKSFEIPWSRLDGLVGLQLQADPVGALRSITTEMIAVSPGSTVEWVIESGLRQASVVVY